MEFTDADRESSSSDEEGPERNWDTVAAMLSPAALQAISDLGIDDGLTREAVQRKTEEAVSAAADRKGSAAEMNAEFKKQEYWDSRFEAEEEYDWLCTYASIKDHIMPFLKPTDKILIVGCGNSSFSADLYDDGFKHITNIDYSGNVVKAMSMKYSRDKPEMLWLEMDMLSLSFADSSFDVVIDKAAMDAVMVDEGDLWHPKEECVQSAHVICLGIARVLHDKGIYLQISFAQPHFRTKYLKGDRYTKSDVNPYSSSVGKSDIYPWTVEYETITVEQGCLNSYLYIMKK